MNLADLIAEILSMGQYGEMSSDRFGPFKSETEVLDPMYENWVDPLLKYGSNVGGMTALNPTPWTVYDKYPEIDYLSERSKQALAAAEAARDGRIHVTPQQFMERPGRGAVPTSPDYISERAATPDLPSESNLYQDPNSIQFSGLTPEKIELIRQQAAAGPLGAASGRNSGFIIGAEATNLGPDQTTEALMQYVKDAKARELDTQISLLERAYPAAQRSPQANAAIEALYGKKAMLLQGEAEMGRTDALRGYYKDTTDAALAGHQATVDAATVKAYGDIQSAQLANYQYLFKSLESDPNGPQITSMIIKILNGPGTQVEKDERIGMLLRQTGLGDKFNPGINGAMGTDAEEDAKLAELFGQPY